MKSLPLHQSSHQETEEAKELDNRIVIIKDMIDANITYLEATKILEAAAGDIEKIKEKYNIVKLI